jgi:hypothetical protein
MASLCDYRGSFWSAIRNPALLAGMKDFSVSFSYENRFAVKGLGIKSAGVVLPAGRASLGAVIMQSGLPDYNLIYSGAGCGIKLGEKIAAGIRIDYFARRTYADYDNNDLITGELALLLAPSERVRATVTICNPLPRGMRASSLHPALKIGTGIILSQDLYAGAEAEFISGQGALLRAGFEYFIVNQLTVRGGYCTKDSSFTMGAGYGSGRFRFDLGFASHSRLGITSVASITFSIGH